mgnify:CR=1 FL=1
MKATLKTLQESGLHLWRQRTSQERWLLTGVSALVGFFLVYSLLAFPLAGAIIQQQVAVQANEATLQWVYRNKLKLQQAAQIKSSSLTVLLSLIHDTLDQDPILKGYPYSLKQTSSGQTVLTFDKVPFDSFMQWAFMFSRQHNFSIKQLQAEKTEMPGVVQLSWHIEVAGA